MNRRTFLGTTAAALASGRRSLAASAAAQPPKRQSFLASQHRNLPIGVFDPPFPHLATESDARKVFQPRNRGRGDRRWGIHGNPQCPVPEPTQSLGYK